MVRESPFIFEDVVPPEKFFDRREELEFFKQSISVKRKILLCIVAPPKYEKTSLMFRYLDILREFPDVIPVYINPKKVDRPISLIVENMKSLGLNLDSVYEECLKRETLLPLFENIRDWLDRNKNGISTLR